MEFAIIAKRGEGLLFDRGRAQLNTFKDARAQDVDTRIDSIPNKLDGFLDKPVDARRMTGLVDDDTELGGFIHLGDNNGTLVPVAFMEVGELSEGVVANNIGIQDEKRRVILGQDLLGQFERAGSAEGFGLDGELNSDIVLFLVL